MPPVDAPDAPVATRCERCDFVFDPARAPGGLCPRCLLLGAHLGPGEELRHPAREEPSVSLADEELARELPTFDLVEILGRGGMGVVWKATERVLVRHVAIKLLHNFRKDMDFVERFTREARVMAQLNHPSIVTLYSFGRTRSNHCYLVMEMVEGTDLGHLVARGPIDLPTALSIVWDVCIALRHAHETGFMHRDIKPGNVLLDARGQVKVTDFGLARLTTAPETTSITKHGWAVGTPHYIAPEQARGDGLEDHRADIYSVGVMLYQMVTGELPRGVFRLPSEKREMDKRLDKVVLRAMQEDPASRYQSVAELMADLQPIRERVDPALKAARLATRGRQRLEMALAAAVALVIGAVIAFYVRDWLEPRPGPREAGQPLLDGGVTVITGAARASLDTPAITKVVRLQPPDLSIGSFFGRSLAADGPWLAVGAPEDGSQNARCPGNVYLYRRDRTGSWSLRQVISNPHRSGARFGYDVAIQAKRLLVGSPRRSGAARGSGRVDLYELTASGKWQRSPAGSFPSREIDATGINVRLAGERIVTVESDAKPSPDPTRAISIAMLRFVPEEQRWLETLPANQSDRIPMSALAGFDKLLTGNSQGSRSPVEPRLVTTAEAPSPAPDAITLLAPILLSEAPGGFRSFAAAAGHALLGNPGWQDSSGVAWTFRCDANGVFARDSSLQPAAGTGGCEFGKSVALMDNWAAIGADRGGRGEPRRGAVYLYHWNAGGWDLAHLIEADAATGAMRFGHSLAITPDFVAIGAPASGQPGATGDEAGVGAVFIREFAGTLK